MAMNIDIANNKKDMMTCDLTNKIILYKVICYEKLQMTPSSKDEVALHCGASTVSLQN